MIDMGQSSASSPALAVAGSAAGVIGGLTAAVAPGTDAGNAGMVVGIGGILMGAATLLSVLGDKWGPIFLQWSKVKDENREEYRKNKEARHRLAGELQKALATIENDRRDFEAEIAALRKEAAEAREKANRSENLAIEAATKLALVEKYTQHRIRRVEEGMKDTAGRLDAVEAQSQSGDELPVSPPPSPRGTPP